MRLFLCCYWMVFHCGSTSFRRGFTTKFLYMLLEIELIQLLRSIPFTPLLHKQTSSKFGVDTPRGSTAAYQVYLVPYFHHSHLPAHVNIMTALQFKFNNFIISLDPDICLSVPGSISQKSDDPLRSVTMVHDYFIKLCWTCQFSSAYLKQYNVSEPGSSSVIRY
jgi:hypothetical protein